MQESEYFQTHYGHVFSDHQPQIFFSSVAFLDVVRWVLAFHKILDMFHIHTRLRMGQGVGNSERSELFGPFFKTWHIYVENPFRW